MREIVTPKKFVYNNFFKRLGSRGKMALAGSRSWNTLKLWNYDYSTRFEKQVSYDITRLIMGIDSEVWGGGGRKTLRAEERAAKEARNRVILRIRFAVIEFASEYINSKYCIFPSVLLHIVRIN